MSEQADPPKRQRPEWVVRHLEQAGGDGPSPQPDRSDYWLLLLGAGLSFAIAVVTLVYRGWFLSGSDLRALLYLGLLGVSTVGGLFFIAAHRMKPLGDRILNKKPRRRATPMPVSHLRFGAESESGVSVKRQSSARLKRRQARREAMRHMPKRQPGPRETGSTGDETPDP